MASSPALSDPIEVFISYAHADESFRVELEKHLSILKRQGVIRAWHDRLIGAGTEWVGQIDKHLSSAGVVLLLISPDFVASDYCYDNEMKRAIERHGANEARVIPVILRPVDAWHEAPFGKLQALPRDGKAVTTWDNRDLAYADIARGIREAVKSLGAKVSSSPHGARDQALPPGLQKLITNSIGMKLVLIPAGEFLMGFQGGRRSRRASTSPVRGLAR